MNIDVSQVRALAVDLTGAGAKAEFRAGQVVRKSGHDLERIAKGKAPVDTGFLRSSIGLSMTGAASVEVGPAAHYGIYVEMGTYKMAAQPYMNPAADAVEPGFMAAMEQLGAEVLGL